MSESTGPKLISQIVANTGLPEDMMSKELGRILDNAGLKADIVSLDDLRKILAEYAQEVLLSVKVEQDELRMASGT